MNDRNIILLGSRGCGKSSVGRRLAAVLGRPFVDIDGRICERFGGRTVAMIWATAGEPAYRAVEDEVTAAACRDAGVALGGGTLMQSRSRTAGESADARRVYVLEPVYRAVADEELDVTGLTIDDEVDRLQHDTHNPARPRSQRRAPIR